MAEERIPSNDLIRKLSLDTFDYYVNDRIFSEVPFEKRDSGLFIRYGRIIVCGIHANRHIHFSQTLRHYELLNFLHENLGTEINSLDQEGLELLSNKEMSDGGRIKLRPEKNEMVFYGSSVDFGRANNEGRLKTIAIAQQIIGREIVIPETTV